MSNVPVSHTVAALPRLAAGVVLAAALFASPPTTGRAEDDGWTTGHPGSEIADPDEIPPPDAQPRAHGEIPFSDAQPGSPDQIEFPDARPRAHDEIDFPDAQPRAHDEIPFPDAKPHDPDEIPPNPGY